VTRRLVSERQLEQTRLTWPWVRWLIAIEFDATCEAVPYHCMRAGVDETMRKRFQGSAGKSVLGVLARAYGSPIYMTFKHGPTRYKFSQC
jgi:hypothetical protein